MRKICFALPITFRNEMVVLILVGFRSALTRTLKTYIEQEGFAKKFKINTAG